ncbi:MAG: hypothetical protein CMM58_06800 [Rhodospirillaceae bacterium]|nr:hypothetical protein [Rhodospirillaceae bacterium]|tara:strand:- start:758 stop:2101 length:1344 start_codon:yes stop_codon:yes gene_type:complete
MKYVEAHNSIELSKFIGSALERTYPEEILEAGKKCLIDWCGVALGARNQAPVIAVSKTVLGWGSRGRAQVLLGTKIAPGAAALINGTMAHCLDYDDTHVGSTTHISAPTIATALAVGTHRDVSEKNILAALISGFEVAAGLGNGAGQPANLNGFHATGIFGSFGSTAAASILYNLGKEEIQNAFGASATQVSGLSASFGTMSKPFHAGKAAFNGILSCELAMEGLVTKKDLIEQNGGLSSSLYQNAKTHLAKLNFSNGWEITRNTFKPYAACLLTHALIDAALDIEKRVSSNEINKIRAIVSEPAAKLANIPKPQTPLEGKFSLAYCAALGLCGNRAVEKDFCEKKMAEPELKRLTNCVELEPNKDMPQTAAQLIISLNNGSELTANVPLALGNPDNPMNWEDIWNKFSALVEPTLGQRTSNLFTLLKNFEEPGSLSEFVALVSAHS